MRISFGKRKEDDTTFNRKIMRAQEREKVRQLRGWLDPNLSCKQHIEARIVCSMSRVGAVLSRGDPTRLATHHR